MVTDGQRLIGNLKRTAGVMGAYVPPGRWPGWIIYLLERLQVEIDAGRYEEFLRSLQTAITTRLEDGQW